MSNPGVCLSSPPSQMRARLRRGLYAGVAALALSTGIGFVPNLTGGFALAEVSQPTRLTAASFSFADIVERVRPAVVSVKVKAVANSERMAFDSEDEAAPRPQLPPGSPMERFFREFGDRFGGGPRGDRGMPRRPGVISQGSGFFISADGYLVTNHHVVDRATNVEITTDEGKTFAAKVVGSDPRTDLALLKVEEGGSFRFVPLAAKAPRVGDWVVAVGNPFGLGGTVTAGIVSARGRDIGSGPYDDYIQIDAPVNRGNSGGPTFNLDGEVIGVNTAIFSPSGGSVGIAFAIPSETVSTVITSLREKGVVTRGWIGVQIQPVNADIAESLGLKKPEGALIAEVQSNGPAAKAGLKSGDVIQQVNGQPVRDARELARRIAAVKPGDNAKLVIIRDKTERTIELAPAQFPSDLAAAPARPAAGATPEGANLPRLGLTLAPPAPGRDGVTVREVDPNGPAANAGLRENDVILDVNGRAVSSAADLREALRVAQTENRRAILLRVRSGDATRFVALAFGRG